MADERLETLGLRKSWEQINDKPINLCISCSVSQIEGVHRREAADKRRWMGHERVTIEATAETEIKNGT